MEGAEGVAEDALVEGVFRDGGHLESYLSMEHRRQQEVMANAVTTAFLEGKGLLFEAGTGVGKSLAYLIPGIIHSMETSRPFIVSTHTKALQEQIEHNDLRHCRRLFAAVPELNAYKGFQVAVLMGRGNYLCTTRLAHAIGTRTELFPSEQQHELERIVEWSMHTVNGLVEELPTPPVPEVWEWVNADSSACSKKHCSPKECFFQRAKVRLRIANLIVVNHSLLFSLLSAGMGPEGNVPGILFAEDFVVLDEAHTIPDIATDHFGMRISSFAVDKALKMLFNPRSKKGIFSRHGKREDCQKVATALASSEAFFNQIRAEHLQQKNVMRLHEPSWMEPLLCEPLKAVIDRLSLRYHEENSESVRNILTDQKRRLEGYYHAINCSLSLEPENHVHWIEKGGKKGQIVVLRTAPIHVAPYLQEAVFNRDTGIVLTSATLGSAGNMEYFCERVGAVEQHYQIEASPFDYEKNVAIFIATDAPVPSVREAKANREYIEAMIKHCVVTVEGGSLVLFTNYADMLAIGREVETFFESKGRPFLIQGRGHSRSKLARKFREVGNGVLFGTDSFWTGVDVPGKALSQVIITRLPFENPSSPIKEAQSEWIQTQGKNPFMHLTLPEAVIKFRQGIGRLIRKKSDRGVITLLDSRLFQKSYGKQFLAALPKRAFIRFDRDHLSVFE